MLQIDKVLVELSESRNRLAGSVLERPLPDYASYMKMVGHYQGLKEAEALVTRIKKEKEL